ncbi:MAG TPA: FAD-dependent oxidoreductase [Polyangia bacterium]|nr:FAD-dependent oxidoreductase [Polyangia bacterium]
MSGSVHHAVVTSIEGIADAVYEYVLTLPADDSQLTWRPGQFISLTCGKAPEGEPLLRSYSIASSPGTGEVRLVIKLIPGGAASRWLADLQVGAPVYFTGPMGFFVLELAHPGDIIFAATGTGLAPVVPMVRELLGRNETGHIHLYWGLRAQQDLFWEKELAALAHPRLSLHVHLSQPAPAPAPATTSVWTGNRGRITGPLLERLPGLHQPTFYLVGNGAMIRELKQALQERGVNRKRQIRTEAFFD